MWRRLLTLCVLATSLAVARGAAAQNAASGPRPTGMGQAFTAVSTGPSGMFHNPAGIATARMYALGGMYEYTPTGNILSAAVVDSKTNPKLSAGAGYSYQIAHDRDEGVSGHDIRLSLAVPALPNKVSIGVGGRYVIFNKGGTGYARGFTLATGFKVQPIEILELGIAGKNLIDVCRKPTQCRGVTPRIIAGGVSVGQSTAFRVDADVETVLNAREDGIDLRFQGGGEFMAGGSFPLRIGYQHLTRTGANHVSFGLGWRESRFGIDLSGDIPVESPNRVTVSAAFEVYFTGESGGSGGGS